MKILLERIKLVDHFKSWFFAEVIHTADVDQKVKAKIVPANSADRLDFVERNYYGDLVAEFRLQQIRKTRFDAFCELRCGHETASNSWRFWSPIARSCIILPCSLIRPSSNASGRGG